MVDKETASETAMATLSTTAAGEEIIIEKSGEPFARLIAFGSRPVRRKPGGLKGQIRISDDFDESLPSAIAKAFGMKKNG